jgi:hypothetical protein
MSTGLRIVHVVPNVAARVCVGWRRWGVYNGMPLHYLVYETHFFHYSLSGRMLMLQAGCIAAKVLWQLPNGWMPNAFGECNKPHWHLCCGICSAQLCPCCSTSACLCLQLMAVCDSMFRIICSMRYITGWR